MPPAAARASSGGRGSPARFRPGHCIPLMTSQTHANIIPTLRYRDAQAAVKWLCDAFGFATRLIIEDDEGAIVHAQLVYANSMVMISSDRENAFSMLQKTPAKVGGVGTQSPYVVVADADAHHERAVALGARVVYPLTNESYGGRGYSCLDPEGYLWNFGTYDPWKNEVTG